MIDASVALRGTYKRCFDDGLPLITDLPAYRLLITSLRSLELGYADDPASLRIRQAESRDAPAILELYQQLVRPVAPDLAIDVRPERIEQIRRDPHNLLWVIESGQEVLGTVFVTLCLDPMYSQQPYAVLENFVIHEHHRTKGCGALLMRHAEDFCYRADCSKIMLQSHGSRLQAHGFFEAQGFSAANKKAFVKYRSQMERE